MTSVNQKQRDSDVYVSLTKSVSSETAKGTMYWWQTTGRNLARMLDVAQYPPDTQARFLSFYLEQICPLFGDPPARKNANSWLRSSLSWDGTPIEYSFDFKETGGLPDVRFSIDLAPVRPLNKSAPLSTAPSQKLLDTFISRNNPDTLWYLSLRDYFRLSTAMKSTPEEQLALMSQACQPSQEMVAFDIHRTAKTPSPAAIPASAKVYYRPCLLAAERKTTRWQVIAEAIRQLPALDENPGIVSSLELIESFLRSQPKYCEEYARFVATDLAEPKKARIKIYIGCREQTFEGVWDWLTLGGRVTIFNEDDKEKIRELYHLVRGDLGEHNVLANGALSSTSDASLKPAQDTAQRLARELTSRQFSDEFLGNDESSTRKAPPSENPGLSAHLGPGAKQISVEEAKKSRPPVICYYSLQGDESEPIPKLNINPLAIAESDAAVAQGFEQWFQNNGWTDAVEFAYRSKIGQVL
ncbi:tryptophan dimethylallyltransferase-domain-containing protein [Whalleya microplaca]|nr:tryptophan dimethylallyltransferase-domain-containing protein [Whalleya microplaca]